MSIFHLLVLSIPGFVLFFVLQKSARKVGKNPLLCGLSGAIVYIIAMLILAPIVIASSRNQIGNFAPGLFLSYSVLALGAAIGAAIFVYKKIPPKT